MGGHTELKIRWKEHQDAREKGVMEKSAVLDNVWENHHPIHWEKTTVLDNARGRELLGEGGSAHPDDTL